MNTMMNEYTTSQDGNSALINRIIDRGNTSQKAMLIRMDAISRIFGCPKMEYEFDEEGNLLFTDNIINLSDKTGVAIDWFYRGS